MHVAVEHTHMRPHTKVERGLLSQNSLGSLNCAHTPGDGGVKACTPGLN